MLRCSPTVKPAPGRRIHLAVGMSVCMYVINRTIHWQLQEGCLQYSNSSIFVLFCPAAVPEEEAGIVSRVAQDLFAFLDEKSEVDASVRVSYVELYREELRDLLELHTEHKELHVREDDRGNTG